MDTSSVCRSFVVLIHARHERAVVLMNDVATFCVMKAFKLVMRISTQTKLVGYIISPLVVSARDAFKHPHRSRTCVGLQNKGARMAND